MIKDIHLRLSPQAASDNEEITRKAARKAGFQRKNVTTMRILRRSIDARRFPPVIDLQLRLFCGEEAAPVCPETLYPDVSAAESVIVVGAGPGGLFAALRLIEQGRKPIVLERGVDIHRRKKDIARLLKKGELNPESNYSFGEGGAGAFSDGKLYTRATKRGDVKKVLGELHRHGAAENILFEAHPHIGTDKLPTVIENTRKTILASGGEVHFSAKVVRLNIEDQVVQGVVTEDGREFSGPVILAIGHSSRDFYRYLYEEGIQIEAKSLAMGVRIEHPQALIDRMQYKNPEGRGKFLPPAEYSFVTQVRERGVYSFCMCPGGFVIPAATASGQGVVNGMSTSKRSGPFANSGMVVEVHPEDLPAGDFEGPLGMMHFQEALERRCFEAGGSGPQVPAQRLEDFMKQRLSKTLPETSYLHGLKSANLYDLFPDFIADRLAEGLRFFGTKARTFLTNEAVLIAAETRTSSPVRIPRDRETLMHVELKGLFPCGEGAGYAGGIVSAALDGINCADRVVEYNRGDCKTTLLQSR